MVFTYFWDKPKKYIGIKTDTDAELISRFLPIKIDLQKFMNWFCIEVKSGNGTHRRLAVAPYVTNMNGQPVSDPSIEDLVTVNNIQGKISKEIIFKNYFYIGSLIASSLYGITILDLFDEILTSIDDLNQFLSDHNNAKCPKTSYNTALIKCFILLCQLTNRNLESFQANNETVELFTPQVKI